MRLPLWMIAVYCATIFGAPAHAAGSSDLLAATGSNPAQKRFSGNVSWYGPQFHGKRTASGAIFDMNKLTCAHRTLPFGTKVLIENPRNGQTVIVLVTDRGPYAGGRVMDLSREAARQLGTLLSGVAYVDCLVIEDDDHTVN
jgi:rare lipoprotein A